MAKLRVQSVAVSQGVRLNQLYQAINTARAQRGDKFVAMGTMRRYWHSTENGNIGDPELDQISWSFLQEVAHALGVSVYDLLPVEDGLGNLLPTPRIAFEQAA